MIENFQRQEQLKSTSPTLEQQTISDSNGNNQNDDNWEFVQIRRNNKKRTLEIIILITVYNLRCYLTTNDKINRTLGFWSKI